MGHFFQQVGSLFSPVVLCRGVYFFFPACYCNIHFAAICTNKYIFDSININGSHTHRAGVNTFSQDLRPQEKFASHGVHNSYSHFQECMK